MRWLIGFLGMLSAFGVSFLQQPRACAAAESTARGVSATAYGGAGRIIEPNNESTSDEYANRRFGVGALGTLRFGSVQAPRGAERGLFLTFGATFELEATRRTVCGVHCPYWNQPGSTPDASTYLDKQFGARLGVGYSWPLFEFRVGGLTAQPSRNLSYSEPLWFPDVVARVGKRSVGWFELGLGAYDASTSLRPGLYAGGALGSPRNVRVSGHFGLHLPSGHCCATLTRVGFRGELGAERALSDSVTLGVSAALLAGLVGEGSLQLSFAL
jgi:hypothetical protein